MSTRLARRALWFASVVTLAPLALIAQGPADPPKAAAANNGAAAPAADVPVKQVVLFSSGVGYFEHFGTVTGDGSTDLRFQTEQINDVLKSLVLQDLDGGRAGTVSYPSQEPIDRTLKSFQVDITANPGLEDLLNQLRGAKLSANTAAGPIERGTIVGVQKRTVTPAVKDKQPPAPPSEIWVLNVKVGRVIRSIPMNDVADFTLDDAKLDAELDRALTALAQSRDQDKKPVTINFRGQGERRVRIGYVVETPVWKTSYRLILGRDAAPVAGEKPPAAGEVATTGKLQGWAIVENQTDSDWNDVQLSLVSGRPISFIQHLYQPLYIPRPVVWPDLYASLRPQTYKGGIDESAVKAFRDGAERAMADEADAPDFSLQSEAKGSGGGQGLFGGSGEGPEETPIDPAASVMAMASAGQLGELFQYTVGNVSLPRQRSAMIPIVTDPLEVAKVSIYNPNVLPTHPLNGARVKNTTGKHLLQGPVTVLDNGGYAGDARIDDIPPGQQRLLSYGVDLQMVVQHEDKPGQSTIQSGRIVKGVLEVSRRDVITQEFVAQNKANVDKTLVFEVPLPDVDYKLIEPAKFDEKTADRYRISQMIKAGESGRLRVVMESPITDQVVIGDPEQDLSVFVKADQIPLAVRQALTEVINRQREIKDVERLLKQGQEKKTAIGEEQTRIRENMKTVSEKTEYYQRLLKKLDEQETAVEAIQKDMEQRQADLQQKRNALSEQVAKLNVG